MQAALTAKEGRIRSSFRKMRAAIDQQESKLIAELNAVVSRHSAATEAKVRTVDVDVDESLTTLHVPVDCVACAGKSGGRNQQTHSSNDQSSGYGMRLCVGMCAVIVLGSHVWLWLP